MAFSLICRQMMSSSFNPYTWDKTSSIVNSRVLNLVLKDHQGQKLTLEGNKESVEIKIPRGLKPAEEKAVSFFVKPSSEGNMQYHTIQVPKNDTKFLRLTVRARLVGDLRFVSLLVKYVAPQLIQNMLN